MDTEIVKLGADDSALAQQLFELMACIFEEDAVRLGQDYVLELLSKDSFWAYAALLNGEIVGGLTAHVLPMTRARSRELMVYDLAVRQESQRTGVGRTLMLAAIADAAAAGIGSVFVAAENVDEHAVAFYQALGGDPAPCTIFTFETAPAASKLVADQ